MNVTRRSLPLLVALLTFILAQLLVPFCEMGLCEELPTIASIEVPGIPPHPDAVPGQPHYRSFFVTYDHSIRPGEAVVIVANRHEIWYLDGKTLEPLEERRFNEFESAVISQDGRYIRVVSWTRSETMGNRLWSMSIEDWRGARLWGMDYRPASYDEPTPSGGFIAYPSMHPKEALDWDLDPDAYPRKVPHGLIIYDEKGDVALEGVSFMRSRSAKYVGRISPDGRYLAFLFRQITDDSSPRGVTCLDKSDRACLVLYDLREGTELWRHDFKGSMPDDVIVSPTAERIACTVSTVVIEEWRDADEHVYLFDRNGECIADIPVESSSRINPVHDIVFSPDWNSVAFKTHDDVVSAVRSSDGSHVLTWKPPPGTAGVGSFAIDNLGWIVAFGTMGKYGTPERREVLFTAEPGSDSTAIYELDKVAPQKRVTLTLGRTEPVVWLKTGSLLRLIRYRE